MNKISYEGKIMKHTFKSKEIACISCANLIKGALEDEFGTIEVNLDTEPKEVSVELSNDDRIEEFKGQMADIGFVIIEE